MPTARQHTIILHGGSRDAKTSRTQIALKHYEDVLANRMKCIMAETAKGIYNWQVPGTSIVKDGRPRWSGAFRADWHVHIGGGTSRGDWEESVATANHRYPWEFGSPANEPGSLTQYIDKERAIQVLSRDALKSIGVETPIYVCNVSPYAHWLNYGGIKDDDTFLGIVPGYQFIAKCIAAVWEGEKKYEFVSKGLAEAAKKQARG